MAQSYRDLEVWKFSMELVRDIYRSTRHFPEEERLGLRSQMRRAAISVPSNIAEGKGRSNRDFGRYLLQARGSLWELQTQIEIAGDLGFLAPDHGTRLFDHSQRISRMLNGLLESVSPRVNA